jgi:uncharacterized protein YceK
VTLLVRLALALGVLAATAGCQTARSFEHGCPGIYSGVRFYADQLPDLPADGVLFFTFDVPISAVVDTLIVPITAALDRQRPLAGWVSGCRWAEETRRS